jgi:hypothetical protein
MCTTRVKHHQVGGYKVEAKSHLLSALEATCSLSAVTGEESAIQAKVTYNSIFAARFDVFFFFVQTTTLFHSLSQIHPLYIFTYYFLQSLLLTTGIPCAPRYSKRLFPLRSKFCVHSSFLQRLVHAWAAHPTPFDLLV